MKDLYTTRMHTQRHQHLVSFQPEIIQSFVLIVPAFRPLRSENPQPAVTPGPSKVPTLELSTPYTHLPKVCPLQGRQPIPSRHSWREQEDSIYHTSRGIWRQGSGTNSSNPTWRKRSASCSKTAFRIFYLNFSILFLGACNLQSLHPGWQTSTSSTTTRYFQRRPRAPFQSEATQSRTITVASRCTFVFNVRRRWF